MIARIWHGVVPTEKARAYRQYVFETGFADYRKTPGFQRAYLLCREEGDVTHFQALSMWDSMEAIRAFAGADPERARYYPEDERYLVELEPRVRHYEVFE